MAIQTKAQLSASNNTAFPDNTSGDITPEILRNYNTASIDSLAFLSGSNTFVGNQIITGSIIATSFTGSLLGLSTSASYASASTSASYALNATNAISATSASYASASTSASYALVADSANTIGNATISGRQTYNFATNNPTGYAGQIYRQAYKFITGSFGVVSGSFQKIMSISSGSSTTWQAVGSISGIVNNSEVGITNYGFYFRPATTSNFSSIYGNASSQGLTNIEFSASWNASTNKIDVFSRYAFNITGSHIIDVSLYSTNTNLTFEFF